MGVEKRPTTVRLSGDELKMFERIQNAFHPFVSNFSQTVVLCGRLVWYMLTTPGILSDIVEVCQRIQCITLYASGEEKAQQLAFHFPPADGYTLHVNMFGRKAPEQARPQPELLSHTKAQVEMAAWVPSDPGKFRRSFAQRSTGWAA